MGAWTQTTQVAEAGSRREGLLLAFSHRWANVQVMDHSREVGEREPLAISRWHSFPMAANKLPQTGGLKRRQVFPHSSGGQKCKIKVGRAVLPPRPLGEDPSLILPHSDGSWHSWLVAASLQSLPPPSCGRPPGHVSMPILLHRHQSDWTKGPPYSS